MLRGVRAGTLHLRKGVRSVPFVAINPLGYRYKSSSPADDKDIKLRVDVRMLGNILGNIVKSSDPNVYDAVEKLREQARSWRDVENGNAAHFDEMVADVASYDTKKLKGVARAFTHFLSLSNSAENHHRVRRIRARAMESGKSLKPRSFS
jgi:phosphoenolpyruvate carboxylase